MLPLEETGNLCRPHKDHRTTPNGMLWIVRNCRRPTACQTALTVHRLSGIYLRAWLQLCNSASEKSFLALADRLAPTRSGVWLSVSFRKSSDFEELLPDMTNWMPLFWPSFTLPLLLSCCFRTRLHIFQSIPSLTSWFYAQIGLKKDRLSNHFRIAQSVFFTSLFYNRPW